MSSHRFVYLCILLIYGSTSWLNAAQRQPNIILIYTDDHGYTDLGVFGIDKLVDTPNMDKLARGGALMTAGYSSAPQCQPSRAGLMIGRIQNEFAFPHNACDAGEGKSRMPCTYPKGTDMVGQPVLTIADRMKKHGYVTGFSGKWHLGPTNHPKGKHEPRSRGFDYYWTGSMTSGSANLTLDGKPAEHHARRGLPNGVANRVILQGKYGEAFITLSKDKPFFLYLPLFGPHIPLIEKSDPYYKNFPELDYPHYDNWRDNRRRMGLALIKSIDDAVGGVMAKLREHGLEENTLILFASDNGAPSKMGRNGPGLPGGPPGTKGGVWNGSNNVPMRGEKGSLFEGGIRVPMFAYWKGRIMPDTVIKEMVTTLDFTATTLKVGGGAIPDEFDGVDLLPRLTGNAGKIDRPKPMFWEFWQTQAVRVGDWKLWRSSTQELLFNVAQDPYELANRVQSDAEVAARLRKLLDQWSASLPRLNKAKQNASEVFAWPLTGAPTGTKADPRYRVPYTKPMPAPYPAPIQRTPVK
jgi:arylsulfatase A-like enzyme